MEDLPESLTVTIRPLADVPESIATLSEMFVQEWAPYYGPGGPGDADADLRASCNRDEIPLTLVAMDDQGQVVGSGALKAGSVGSAPGEGPWIAALIVSPTFRRRGVGTAMMDALIEKARQLDCPSIYISTDASDRLIKKWGWLPVRRVPSLRGPTTVFRLDLT